ncbi:hypothetical protein L2D01_05400 [Hyphomonadaceae bacterium ML37]|nr:hypothetical protein L2D01_05400 [Hyphomonadaceae bacterium ML37]
MIFQLFRIKVERDTDLFANPDATPSYLISKALAERPKAETRKNQLWRIGNYEILDDLGNVVFFAFGKVTKSRKDSYDEDSGSFIEQEGEDAPHTYALIDAEIQVCAIAPNYKVSQNAATVARNLAKSLSMTDTALENRSRFRVDPIMDPQSFIELLQSAERIVEFEIGFTRPNPFDVNRQFQRPMEELLQETDGFEGTTKIKGEALGSEPLEELARSAAAAGNSASARIQLTDDVSPKKRKLAGNQASVNGEEVVTLDEKRTLWTIIKEKYSEIRQGQ